jgi:hypothetical protein
LISESYGKGRFVRAAFFMSHHVAFAIEHYQVFAGNMKRDMKGREGVRETPRRGAIVLRSPFAE